MRRARFGSPLLAPERKPDVEAQGHVEVESTDTSTTLRMFSPSTGDVAEMELGAREAVGIAAQLVFCAMRHFPTAEAALNAFRDAMHEATTDAIRQAREGKPS